MPPKTSMPPRHEFLHEKPAKRRIRAGFREAIRQKAPGRS
jgi:hypothetical protein